MISSTQHYRIFKLDEVDSTNDHAKQMLREGLLQPFDVVVAESQTAGKGQRGNRWEGQAGKDLMFSFLLPLEQLPIDQSFRINAFLSVVILEVLQSLGLEEVKVKWPNDIYVKQKKICGMLIENQLRRQQIHQSIVGVGLNVQGDFSNKSDYQATSVRAEGGADIVPDSILNRIMEGIVSKFDVGFLDDTYFESYATHQLFKHQIVQVKGMNTQFTASVQGPCKDGGLRVLTADGKEMVIYHHEFQIRPE